MADKTDAIVFVLVVGARLVLPLFIPRFPLPAIVAALVVDAVDKSVFQTFTHLDLDHYQTYDKALDVYYLTIAYAATIRNWGGGDAFVVGRVLWYYRLAGVVLFEYTQIRWLLVVFPNTFEYFFIAIELVKVSWNPFALARRQVIGLAAAIWICIKLPQEWWLHVARLDVTDVARVRLFGVPEDEGWGAALAHRPWVVALLLAGTGAVVLVAGRVSRALPAADWPPTVSADVQGNHLGWSTPPDEVMPFPFFGWPFVEKAALVTLVTLIFGRILPGAHRGVSAVAISTTSVIAVNTLISHALARRGLTWRSTGAQFVAMTTADVGIGLIVAEVVPGAGRSTPLGTFLFLVGLLTLIVVLFDRSKLIDVGHRRRSWGWTPRSMVGGPR